MLNEPAGKRILVALDFPNLKSASSMATRLKGKTGFKVGMQLCTAAGVPSVVGEVGEDIFLDLKFHDIPNTVAGAIKAAAMQRVKMLNVHCLGGPAMLHAAVKAADESYGVVGHRPMVLGVTILTSQDRNSLDAIGIDPEFSMENIVCELAKLAHKAGLDGVVCSPKEIKAVRDATSPSFAIVTPGIRKKDAPPDDQKRTLTAGEAITLGATYLVIGRPITEAADPEATADEFIAEIEEAVATA